MRAARARFYRMDCGWASADGRSSRSRVVQRNPQARHSRRRYVASSVCRVSITFEDPTRQSGQRRPSVRGFVISIPPSAIRSRGDARL